MTAAAGMHPFLMLLPVFVFAVAFFVVAGLVGLKLILKANERRLALGLDKGLCPRCGAPLACPACGPVVRPREDAPSPAGAPPPAGNGRMGEAPVPPPEDRPDSGR